MAKEKKDNITTISEGDLRSLLREYREIAGYSLTQMAEALCLSDDALNKLENEEFQDLAEPPYVRGYLRNYAKVADKDPSRLINIYEKLRGANPDDLDYHFKAKPKILSESKKTMSPVMGQLLLLSLLLALLVGVSMVPAVNKWIKDTWNSFSQQSGAHYSPNVNNQDLIGSMPVPQPLPIENQVATDEKKSKNDSNSGTTSSATTETTTDSTAANTETSSSSKSTTTDATQEAEIKTSTTEESNQQASTETTTTTTKKLLTPETLSQVSTGDEVNIKLIFNSEVWMRIRDKDNRTVFEGLNTMGGSKSLTLTKPLHFRVGNAQGLSLFIDDQALDISAHIRGSVAKFTLE